jgi:hypothetical protein
MTIPSGAYLTLVDLAKRTDPMGQIDDIAEYLSQANEIYDDMIWMEGNLPTGHKTTLRTSIPSGTWRLLNQGVPVGKSTTAQVTVGCGMLENWSVVDRKLAEMSGNIDRFRYSEDNAFLEGMSQQVAKTFWYGNITVAPSQFTGYSPLFNTVSTATALNAVNVLDGMGIASSNTSIWLIGWGEETAFAIYPKGSMAGLKFEDRGDVVPAQDASGNWFMAYSSWFRQEVGLCVRDWRYVVRIANLDTTSAGFGGANAPDIFALLSKAVVRLPRMAKMHSGITKTDSPQEPTGIRPAIYMNRTSREYADIQAIRDRNVLLGPRDYAGEPVTSFRGIPIRVNDQQLNSEARVV